MLNKLIGLLIKVAFSAIFLLVVTPVGTIFKILGMDLLEEKIDHQAPTYWRDHS
jgi:hypothetical protein